ncbi:MAG: hypothetical protein ACFFC3_04755 [Candidatus Odinarchaeota archaeon]
MDVIRKRIIAILPIAVIGISIGVGIFTFYISQEKSDYATPGVPSNVNLDHIIKVLCVSDRGEFRGDANYKGTYLSVKEINKAGGITVNGTPYYFGINSLDTDENTPRSISHSIYLGKEIERLIEEKKPDFVIGGQRAESVFWYRDYFMDAEILFLGTGVSSNILCDHVLDDYDRYKYFIRCSPLNSTEIDAQMISILSNFILDINITYPNHEVKDIGILGLDLYWVESTVEMIQTYLPINLLTFDCNINVMEPILYDFYENETDLNTYLESFQSDGADIIISSSWLFQDAMMMQQYELNHYEYLIFCLGEEA